MTDTTNYDAQAVAQAQAALDADRQARIERAAQAVAQAQATLDADRQARIERAAQGIREVLLAERCQLVAVPQIAPDGRIAAAVQIVAL